MPECRFAGSGPEHCNHHMVIENVSRNGIRLKPEEVLLDMGEFDHHIEVR